MACNSETSIICCLQDKAHTIAGKMQTGSVCPGAINELQLMFIYAAILSDCKVDKHLTTAQKDMLMYKLKRYCR